MAHYRAACGGGRREVMAVPGSPLDPRSRGCNQLIREGATLVQNASEIAVMIHPIDNRMPGQSASHANLAPKLSDDGSNAERRAVIDLMGITYVSVDELVRQSGSSTATVRWCYWNLSWPENWSVGQAARFVLQHEITSHFSS